MLERIRRQELREIDPYTAISWLCGPADSRSAPRAQAHLWTDRAAALLSNTQPAVIAFAKANRVLLLRASSDVGLDIALGGLPFEESAVARSSHFTFPLFHLARRLPARRR